MQRLSSPVVFIVILLISVSCSNFRKIEKSQDWRVKYEAGLNYYNKKDYYRASVLFEQILPIVRGLPEGEKVQFYLAYCQYYDKLYLLAAEQFKTFYETYGRSSMAEEARFMHAFSLYQSSPNPNLDQSSSIESMAAMQQFINRFPNSPLSERAAEVIATTQQKLEKKGFENARQYWKDRSSFFGFRQDFRLPFGWSGKAVCPTCSSVQGECEPFRQYGRGRGPARRPSQKIARGAQMPATIKKSTTVNAS